MDVKKLLSLAGFGFSYVLLMSVVAFAQTPPLLNVSYDVSRELYKQINPAFIAAYKASAAETLTINQSHGGSSKQAGAIIGGLEADVITMNQSPDIDILVERGGLVAKDWRKNFPHDSAPYASVSIFVVRKGNPKGIKDWSDLIKPGTQVIVPNPKLTGNGRYTYVAALGYGLKALGSEAAANEFVAKLFANVPVLDGGGRGATTTFAQRDIGDVLVTFENEAVAIEKEFGAGKFEVIYPSVTVEAPAPVAIVETVAAKRKTRAAAKAYLDFLFSPEGQEIIARNSFRPRDPAVLARHANDFPKVVTFTVEELLGGWAKVNAAHFADGAYYDQFMARR